MMSSHSVQNIQQTGHADSNNSIFSYLNNQKPFTNSTSTIQQPTSLVNDNSPPPTPPVRDASSLKGVKYGPGHEKFPSWPVAAATEAPQVLRGPPSGGSHRSKSWTDHTNYPKEKVVTYTRPYMKRPNSQTKLKTVMERCEKIPPESFESRQEMDDCLYLPRVDREGKALGDLDYMVPSPPERDITKPQLSQKDLEEYARSYHEQPASPSSTTQPAYQQLTQADLEEYTRSYEEALSHQKQPSYAQSEGYHSYVSSTDSMSTPFLDRLRRDSEAVVIRNDGSHGWDDLPERERDMGRHEGRDSVVTTSSGSASSSETLKWHGSMSDVSVASSSYNHSNSPNSRQLIAHSARVQTPQRHNSESVLYIGTGSEQKTNEGVWKERESRNNHHNKLKLFAVNTYTVQPDEQPPSIQRLGPQSHNQSSLSVADRVSELERQQTRYTYLDPEKRHRVSDPTLKAIQKKALLSFYERHHSASTKNSSWRSEPQLAQPITMPQTAHSPPPQPPPRPRAHPASRRASSASDYAKGGTWRENLTSKRESDKLNKETPTTQQPLPRHQHSNSCGSLSSDLLGPVIMGPSISIDDWVPERPPKNPHLRTAFPDLFQDQRVPSPDLPPPSPPPVLENEVFNNDEPLPPPPPELESPSDWSRLQDRLHDSENGNAKFTVNHSRQRSEQIINDDNMRQRYSPPRSINESQVRHNVSSRNMEVRLSQRVRSNSNSMHQKLSDRNSTKVPMQPVIMQQKIHRASSTEEAANKRNSFIRSISYEKDRIEQTMGYAAHRQIHTERASMRHPSTQKLVVNGRVSVAVSQKVHSNAVSGQYRAEPLRPHHLIQHSREESIGNNRSALQSNSASRNQNISEDKFNRHSQKQVPPLQPRQMPTPYQNHATENNGNGYQYNDEINDSRVVNHSAITTSQSKASYLAYRRDREKGQPDADHGSYKRTMSPAGHRLSLDLDCAEQRSQNNSNEDKWSANINRHRHSMFTKDSNENNNSLLLHRLSLNEPIKKKDSGNILTNNNNNSKLGCNLPDLVSVKVAPPRSLPLIDETKSPSTITPLNRSPKSPKEYYKPLSPTSSCTTSPTSKSSVQRPTASQILSSSKCSPTLDNKSISSNKTQSDISSAVTSTTGTLTSTSVTVQRPSLSNGSNDNKSPPRSPLMSPPHSPEPLPCCTEDKSKTTFSSSLSLTSTQSPPTISTSTRKEPAPIVLASSHQQTEEESSSPPPPPVIEGLQLIQRTEVILRVNTCTSDAASQTEQRDAESSKMSTPLPSRKQHQEEIECERLSRDLANQLSPSDRLKDILAPAPEHKKPTDYVSGLFKLEVTSRPRSNGSTRSMSTSTNSPPASPTASSPPQNPLIKNEIIIPSSEPSSPLSATSTYFTTSESKAKFLTQYSRNMPQYNGVKDSKDLNQKKEELMNRLDRKLEVLRSEQLVVSEESRVNDCLGEQVTNNISRLARPQEVAKYRLHVEEVGKITSLLLGLSGRLARAENALMGLPSDHTERKILEGKRDKLQEQLEEAKKLKENIDRRSINVSNILYKYLNSEEYADYDHFINMKAKLIMDAREIADKIKLGEEQLVALRETLSTTAG